MLIDIRNLCTKNPSSILNSSLENHISSIALWTDRQLELQRSFATDNFLHVQTLKNFLSRYFSMATKTQGGRGHWAVYYTSTQSSIITFFLIGWSIKSSVPTFQPPIVIAEGIILCIIIGDVHKFIDHCLIPLDPCSGLG